MSCRLSIRAPSVKGFQSLNPASDFVLNLCRRSNIAKRDLSGKNHLLRPPDLARQSQHVTYHESTSQRLLLSGSQHFEAPLLSRRWERLFCGL